MIRELLRLVGLLRVLPGETPEPVSSSAAALNLFELNDRKACSPIVLHHGTEAIENVTHLFVSEATNK